MRYLLLIIVLSLTSPARAVIEAYEFKSAQMESDYTQLINELRCLVCQNQNLASSNADLAKDLRKQTYKMLNEGNSVDQVADYMVARYGDFVLYRPPLKPGTWLLWLGPFVFLVLVLALVIRKLRNRQILVPPDEEAMSRAKQLLSDKQE